MTQETNRPVTSYEFTPVASLVTAAPIYAIAPTKSWKWVFTGGSDGRITKYDHVGTIMGKTMLTQNQRSGQVETVVKGGHLLSYWYNEESKDSQANWTAARLAPPATTSAHHSEQHDAATTAAVVKPEPVAGSEALKPPAASTGAASSSIGGISGSTATITAPPIPPAGVPDISPVFALAAHSEAQWVIAGTRRGGVALYSARHDEGTQFACLPGHTDMVSAVQIVAGEDKVLSGSWDSSVLLSDLHTGKPICRMTKPISTVASIEAHPSDPNSYLITSLGGLCTQWDIRSPTRPSITFELPAKTPPWALSACYNPRSEHIYIGRRNYTVDEFAPGGKFVRTLTLPRNSGQVSRVLCMENGRSLLIGSTDIVRQWDLDHSGKGVPFTIIPGHGANVADFAVDPSSRFMICTSGNRGWETNVKDTPLSLVFTVAKVYE
ncbi:WD40-repeat-containing domain protein [Catenaria anguillulae PL171]|uniref:WD40-repeat-containing domain protein n=1 Tax=Catenaria anguillulae PL171 TaxID=765915 RepID=A0A1Y2HQL0_9FUNG|nr:WD40-repeat-containing domain protein [Catenaria anguillulae PL171]